MTASFSLFYLPEDIGNKSNTDFFPYISNNRLSYNNVDLYFQNIVDITCNLKHYE